MFKVIIDKDERLGVTNFIIQIPDSILSQISLIDIENNKIGDLVADGKIYSHGVLEQLMKLIEKIERLQRGMMHNG